jgi:uroporphyrin-III C-methyltransferase / precorrin-2 dehydrogenase / sirohydrochlorin ferrochelatase
MIFNEPNAFLVGAGPGDPDLLTVKAAALLRSADLILHDDLVPPPILALAGPLSMVVNVGKRCGIKKITQLEINRMMIAAARRGMRVIRLKSGDPGVFGRLAEELDALEAADIAFEVVPGITAGVAAAASLRVSLTDRRKSSRILIVSGHQAQENQRTEKTDWKALAREDTMLVIYMPGRDLATFARELLDAGLSPATPAVVVSRASTPQQREWCTTLAGLPSVSRTDAPAILLIGRSLERAAQRAHANHQATALDEDITSLLHRIGAEPPPESFKEDPKRRLAP